VALGGLSVYSGVSQWSVVSHGGFVGLLFLRFVVVFTWFSWVLVLVEVVCGGSFESGSGSESSAAGCFLLLVRFAHCCRQQWVMNDQSCHVTWLQWFCGL